MSTFKTVFYTVLALLVIGLLGAATYQNMAPTGSFTFSGLSSIVGGRGNTVIPQLADGDDPDTDECAKFDANNNLTGAGAACGSGSATGYPLVFCDDFIGESGSGPTNNAEVGYNFTWFYTGATGAYAAETGAEGILQLTTGTSSGNSAAVALGAQSPRAWTNLNTYPNAKWWEWVFGITSTTSIRAGGGLAADNGPTNDGVHFNFDTDNTETTMRFFSRNSASDTSRIDSTVTMTAANWYRVRLTKISSPANGIQFQIASGQSTEASAKTATLGTAYTICPDASCTVNATIDTDAVLAYFAVTTRTAGAKTLNTGSFCWSSGGWQ